MARATDEMKGKLGKVWADANEAVKAAEGNEFVTQEEKRGGREMPM